MRPRVRRLRWITTALLLGSTLSALPASHALASGVVFKAIRPLAAATATPTHGNPQGSPVAAGRTGNFPYRPLPHRQYAHAVPTDAGTIQTANLSTTTPSTARSFEGLGQADNFLGVLPPDPNGDIGYDPANGNKRYYVQWVNLVYAVFDPTTGSRLGTFDPTSLFASQPNQCSSDNNGDPIVQFDQLAHRWVLTQFAFDSNWLTGEPMPPYLQCIAVSDTGNPMGSYHTWAYDVGSFGTNDYFPDYPKLGIWPNAYNMTFNYFSGTNLSTFNGAGFVVFDRQAMLAGSSSPLALTTSAPLGSQYGGLLPVDLDGSTLPPTCNDPSTYTANCVDSFIAADTNTSPSGSTLQTWHVTSVDFVNAGARLTGPINLTVPAYNWALCAQSRNCIPQPGTKVGLDSLSDRLMYRAAYRVLGGAEHLILNQTVNVATTGNQAAIRWYDIGNISTTPTQLQLGTYAPDTTNRWMGSAAMDQSGDIAIGYSASSSSVYPSIRYAGRVPSDPSGTLETEQTLQAGGGVQTSSSNRWGDYSALTLDPLDGCTFWYTNEYYSATSDSNWQTRIGSFSFPGCGGPPPPAPAAPTNVAASTVSSTSLNVTWTASSGATSYSLLRGTAGSYATVASGITSTTYTDTGLSPCASYTYEVTASNAGGTSPASTPSSATTTAPAAPVLSVTSTTSSGIGLSWTARACATSYDVFESTTNSNFTQVAHQTATTFTYAPVARRTNYYFYVVAEDSRGNKSPNSNTVKTTTPRK